MKILHLNKFGRLVGGSERYMLDTASRQSEHHSVAVAGSHATSNPSDGRLQFFNLDIPDFHAKRGLISSARTAAKTVWSEDQADAVEKICQIVNPDVVHVHLYAHQLTSSVIQRLKDTNIPFVHTSHDYKLICPAYVANIHGQDCFACAKRLSSKVVSRRCLHNSVSWSSVAAIEALVTRRRESVPHQIIAPSEYMRDALANSWVREHATIHLARNPADVPNWKWLGGGDYVLFVGRLSAEKGVHTLIESASVADIPLRIAGEGPERTSLEELAVRLGANVAFLGWLSPEELEYERAGCRAQVIPSEWPENAPLALTEGAIAGVPIIASDRGGLPEYRALGARLRTVSALDANSLAASLTEVSQAEVNLESLAASLSWSKHLHLLDQIYRDAIGEK